MNLMKRYRINRFGMACESKGSGNLGHYLTTGCQIMKVLGVGFQ